MPEFLRAPLFGFFSFIYGVRIEEATRPFEDYTTFTDFFTRTLMPGVRTIHRPNRASAMCSPCDGAILTIGVVNETDSTVDCVKGRSYRLDEFMTGVKESDEGVKELLKQVSQRGNRLYYMVIYLSPGDYHRFHSPAVHTALFRRHIAGYLSPVKPNYVRRHKDVFKNNERVNIFGQWQKDLFMFISYVGALNVGSIVLDFDPEVITNMGDPAKPYY